MWLVLSLVLHGPAQQSNLDLFCVALRIALLSRFLPEAMNLPPDERGGWGVGEGGTAGEEGGYVYVCVAEVEMSPDSW